MEFLNWFIDPIKNQYADFEGRATRKEYGMYVLVLLIINTLLNIGLPLYDLDILLVLWSLVIAIPSLAIAVRRIHDLDKSGWWGLMFFIPLLNLALLIGLLVRKGDVGPNTYGVPKDFASATPQSEPPMSQSGD